MMGHRSGHVRRGELSKFEKVHECNVCHLRFDRGYDLNGHRYIHTPFENLKSDGARRKRIVLDKGHQCEICHNTLWMNKPIPLTLDHIDGNTDNHLRDNLRVICPNCHAQTDTYCGKNVGRFPLAKRTTNRGKYYARVVQRIEQVPSKHKVGGSNPSSGTIPS